MISSATGKILDIFTTENEVKTSGIFQNGYLYFGSHDGFCYIFSVEGGKLLLITSYNTLGAIFGSPVIINEETIAYVNTKGYISLLSSNNLLWSGKVSPKPIFASAVVYKESIIICGVDGVIRSISLSGHEQWNTSVSGQPIFSSPCLYEHYIIFGTHGSNVLCFDLERQVMVWNYKCDAIVNSSPSIVVSNSIPNVVSISVTGAVSIINLLTGTCTTLLSIPGPVYSSPTIFVSGDSLALIVGSRDNGCYAFFIEQEQIE